MSKPGTTPITAPGRTGKRREGVTLVDCDIHHNFKSASDLMTYMPKFYQDHLIDQGLHLPGGGFANVPYRQNRPDLKEPELQSREVNFSLEFMQEHHLDLWNVDLALLTGPPPSTDTLVRRIRIGQPSSVAPSTIGRSNIGWKRTIASSTPSLFHPAIPGKL